MMLFNSTINTESSLEEILQKGKHYYSQRKFHLAASCFDRYLNQSKGFDKPGNKQLILDFGISDLYILSHKRAFNTFELLNTKYPDWDIPYLYKAICLNKTGRIEAARQAWQIAADKGNAYARKGFDAGIKNFF